MIMALWFSLAKMMLPVIPNIFHGIASKNSFNHPQMTPKIIHRIVGPKPNVIKLRKKEKKGL
jgi:hypothetical protein